MIDTIILLLLFSLCLGICFKLSKKISDKLKELSDAYNEFKAYQVIINDKSEYNFKKISENFINIQNQLKDINYKMRTSDNNFDEKTRRIDRRIDGVIDFNKTFNEKLRTLDNKIEAVKNIKQK